MDNRGKAMIGRAEQREGAGMALLRWPVVLAFVAAAVLPLLFTPVPPLIDLPGHLGRFAIQAAPEGNALRTFYEFRWGFALNLGTDLLVEGLRRLIGLEEATWLAAALIPALTVAGVAAVARVCNPRGAYALGWAMVFVHGFAFRYGFLNFGLGVALSLLGFALWRRIGDRPGLRAALFVPLSALVLVVHAVGGGLMTVLIIGDHLWRGGRAGLRRPAGLLPLWPLLGGVVTAAFWMAQGGAGGATKWVFERKLDGLMMAARDQSPVLDIATVALAALVLLWGWRSGARMRAAGAVTALALLFVAIPSVLSGVAHVDERLMPALAMLALALQDWSAAPERTRRIVLWSGVALFAMRLAVTTTAFAGYGASYARELQALDHVAPESRVLVLTQVECGMREWRGDRLDHLSNLATVYRHAWVNSHWAMEGVQTLRVRYRPSPDFAEDPSEFVWPEHCVDKAKPFADRSRHTLAETLPRLPLGKVDYLWLIGTGTPANADPRLQKLWSIDASVLYAVRPVPIRAPSP